MSIVRLIKRFLPYLKPVKACIALTALIQIVDPLASVALLALVASLIDTVFVGGRIEYLPYYLAGYAGLLVAKCVITRVDQRVDTVATLRIAMALKADLFKRVISLSPGSGSKLSSGAVLSHMASDVDGAEYIIFSGTVATISNALRVIFYGLFLFTLSVKLTLLSLLFLPLLAYASFAGTPRIKRAARIVRRRKTSLVEFTEERLSARPVLLAFHAEQREVSAFLSRCTSVLKAELRSTALQARLSITFELLTGVTGIVLIAAGAYQIHAHAITVGALIAYLGSLGSLYGPAQSLAKTWTRFHRAGVGAERVAEILDTPSAVSEVCAPAILSTRRGELTFSNVHFGYVNDADVLRGVSLGISSGESVAIVGSSGAGKSTLMRLALRFYDPRAGQVMLDGCDLRELALGSVRNSIATVFQEPHIFTGTVGANIQYGDPSAPLARMAAAARAAQADGFIARMQGGYCAKVDPRGSSLSGGQRQRLALARALMRDAPLLFLDEATASLDGESEELIQDALQRLAGRRTIITIAHRLSSVRRADRVILLEDGRIAEIGTPQKLLTGNTRCRELFAAQIQDLRISA